MLFYEATRIVAGPLLHLFGRPRATGVEHVPATGPAILAANHLSALDSAFMPFMLPRHVTFPAKSEYFTGNPLMALYMRATRQLSIERGAGRAAQAALEASVAVLERGELFGIYPEGTRSPDGRLHKGKTGVAWLALTAGVPVVPVGVVGTDRVLPAGSLLPRPAKVEIHFGVPMTFDGDAGRARVRREVTDEIMAAIQKLSGQEAVDAYAESVKRRG